MAVSYEDIDFGLLLWPDSFKFQALARTKPSVSDNSDLWALYQKFFMPFENMGSQPAPFSAAVDDLESEQPLFEPLEHLPLSIVVITRNDLHVERMEERTQAFIDGIVYLADHHKTNVELILVEWNPPEDRKPMAEQYKFPDRSEFCTIKIVTVPTVLHNTYDWAERLPLYQMIGKNAGIRRARGQFVLVTNIDILLSHSLFKYITSPERESGHIYRSNRWDVDMDILDIQGSGNQIKAATQKCFRVNYREGGIPFDERHTVQEKVPTFDPEYMWYPDLHTEGCGDFQMLHQTDWFKVRGYAETDCFCYHMDSLFAFTCHYAGIREVSLSDEYPHFHIDHTVGTVVDSDVYTIAEKQTVRHISCESIIALSSQMFHKKDFMVFNRANWGLSDHDLPITAPTKASWDQAPDIKPNTTDYEVGPTYGHISDFPLLNSADNQEGRLWLEDCTMLLGRFLDHHAGDRDIYIWGAGKRGQYCRAALEKHTDKRVRGFLQTTRATGSDKELDGLPIKEAAHLATAGARPPFIIVASIHAESIRHTIEQQELVEGEDFIIWS